jgi:hypothetical protein
MNILHEIRNAFGFPQLFSEEVQQEEKTLNTPIDYRVGEGDDEEDYFPQLGIV